MCQRCRRDRSREGSLSRGAAKPYGEWGGDAFPPKLSHAQKLATQARKNVQAKSHFISHSCYDQIPLTIAYKSLHLKL